jgi:hypothetical protein
MEKTIGEVAEHMFKELVEQIEENDIKEGVNVDCAVGTCNINGVAFQIQLSLVSDKNLWVKEGEPRLSECVRIHE